MPDTGKWLRSVVQGYFNYYAVPGNCTSRGIFRARVMAYWWRAYAAVVRHAQSRRRAFYLSLSAGFPHRVCSTRFLMLVLPRYI